MKQLLCFVLLLFCLQLSAQQTSPDSQQVLTPKQSYLLKASKQRSGAIALLVVGGIFMVAGTIVAVKDLSDLDIFVDNSESDNSAVAGVLVFTGMVAMLGSIPVFIASHRNKKKAMQLSLQPMSVQQLNAFTVKRTIYPALRLTLPL